MDTQYIYLSITDHVVLGAMPQIISTLQPTSSEQVSWTMM